MITEKLRGPTVSRSFCIIFEENYFSFLILEAGIFFMAAESTALSMVREVVFGVGFALLLPRFFGLDGVLYSMPLSDILTFLIAGYLIYKTYHELNYHIALDSGDRH